MIAYNRWKLSDSRYYLHPYRPHPGQSSHSSDGRTSRPRSNRRIGGGSLLRRLIRRGATRTYHVLESKPVAQVPARYDTSGLPVAWPTIMPSSRTVLPRQDNIRHYEITVDRQRAHRPWSCTRKFERDPEPQPCWRKSSARKTKQHGHSAKRIT